MLLYFFIFIKMFQKIREIINLQAAKGQQSVWSSSW